MEVDTDTSEEENVVKVEEPKDVEVEDRVRMADVESKNVEEKRSGDF